MLSFKCAASCLYSIAAKIGLWQLFVSWFNVECCYFRIHCHFVWYLFYTYAFTHTTQYPYNTCQLHGEFNRKITFQKNAKRQCCHISMARTRSSQYVHIIQCMYVCIAGCCHWQIVNSLEQRDVLCVYTLYTWKFFSVTFVVVKSFQFTSVIFPFSANFSLLRYRLQLYFATAYHRL